MRGGLLAYRERNGKENNISSEDALFAPVFSKFGLKLIEEIKQLHPYPVLLLGDTGWGKTILAKEIARQRGLSYLAINGRYALDTGKLLGFMRPVSTPAGISLVWQDGLLTKAVKEGYIFLFEEFTRAPEENKSILYSILDSVNRSLSIPEAGIDSIPIHTSFQLIATANPPKAGYTTNRLDIAMESRFEAIYEINEPLADEDTILATYIEDADIRERYTNFVADLRGKQQVSYPTRDFVRILRLYTKGFTILRALEIAMASRNGNVWDGIAQLYEAHFGGM